MEFLQHELRNDGKEGYFFFLSLLVVQLLILLFLDGSGRKCRAWFSIIFFYPPKSVLSLKSFIVGFLFKMPY